MGWDSTRQANAKRSGHLPAAASEAEARQRAAHRIKASGVVAARATDREDCVELLQMLGLRDTDETGQGR